MRILVDHSGYPLLNVGDVAMLQACVRRLQNLWPNADIQVFTDSPERLEQHCAGVTAVAPTFVGRGAASVAPMSFQLAAEQIWKMAMPLLTRSKRRSGSADLSSDPCRVLEAVRQADLVVSSGGGFISDVCWWHGVGVLSVLAMAQRLGTPTAMFGQGIGPLTHPVLTRLVTLTMPRLLVIGLREGSGSVPLLRARRVGQERIQVTGDDSLLLATMTERPPTGIAIGLNIRVASYSGIDTSVASQAVAVTSESARRRGVTTLVLPVSRNKFDSDLKALRACGAGHGDNVAGHEFADIHTPEELAEHAARCRVIVTGSYHAAVFGLAAGVPAVCITSSRYYDLKFEGLGALFPGGCHLVRPGPLFERELSDAIDRAWETSETGRDSIHSAALAQVAKADEIYTRFKSLVTPDDNSVLVGERSVFQHEQAMGLSASAYLAGKVIVYSIAALIQGIIAAITIAAKGLPTRGALLGRGALKGAAKLYVTPVATTVASALVRLAPPPLASLTVLVKKMGRERCRYSRNRSFSMFRLLATAHRKTDYKRWADPSSLEASWQPRTRTAAALVPNCSRVIEFGAGNRTLERYLDPSCTYVASDIVDRGPGTIICDLNQRPLPDLGASHDVAVFMGVLEYLRDVPSVLDWLAKHVPVCVLSYVYAENNRYSLRGMREAIGRLQAGWMNNYREDELRSLFRERGFVLLREERWEDRTGLFVFSQRRSLAGDAAAIRRP